ncbi:hypothetical protein B0H16DRAFT_1465541 [Mycena metata]|uniref:Uncharacterized protein n=1 Tax=Mycena metata TaxID=1033252 RepID=A0AAD7IAZ4_9AGAR|nr:hypothetical protein B0H16DRAFT_1465541 [Mycena metata]
MYTGFRRNIMLFCSTLHITIDETRLQKGGFAGGYRKELAGYKLDDLASGSQSWNLKLEERFGEAALSERLKPGKGRLGRRRTEIRQEQEPEGGDVDDMVEQLFKIQSDHFHPSAVQSRVNLSGSQTSDKQGFSAVSGLTLTLVSIVVRVASALMQYFSD